MAAKTWKKPKPVKEGRSQVQVSLSPLVEGWLDRLVEIDAAKLGVRADRHRSTYLSRLIREEWIALRLEEEVAVTDREIAAGR